MSKQRIVVAGTNPTKDLTKQRNIIKALKKIALITKRIVGKDVEFDLALDAGQVSPMSCDLLIVVGSQDDKTTDIIKKYRSFNRKGDARLVDLKSRYRVVEQLYIAYLAWQMKLDETEMKMVA